MRDMFKIKANRVPHPAIAKQFPEGKYPAEALGDAENGCFMVKIPLVALLGQHLRDHGLPHTTAFVIASCGDGWEHVSISCENRTPHWVEMDYIKRMFFEPDEVVIQIHPAEEDHINLHNNCLHLWRPINQEIPLPPKVMV